MNDHLSFLLSPLHVCKKAGMVVRHVTERKNIDAISSMAQFKNYQRWFLTSATHPDASTKRLFFDFLHTACASIMVSFFYTFKFSLFLPRDSLKVFAK